MPNNSINLSRAINAEHKAILHHQSLTSSPNPDITPLYAAMSFYPDSNDRSYIVFYLYNPGGVGYIIRKGGNLSNNQLSNVETKSLENFTGILTLEKVAYAWNNPTYTNNTFPQGNNEYTLSQISLNEAELADYTLSLIHI